MDVGNRIWKVCERMNCRAYHTIGKQLVRSTDSIAANIAEGFGRWHYRDKQRFCYISRGSLQESLTWLEKARSRRCLSEQEYDSLREELIEIP